MEKIKQTSLPSKNIRSIKWKIFLTCWVIFTAHFATNVVREHYPAFSLIDHGTFQVDEYQGFHPDIFVHKDGHSYIGNNVTGSVIAAIPLLIFKPVLDWLGEYGKAKVAKAGKQVHAEYRTDKPNRRRFFKLVKQRGLYLRFGAATVITSAFLMAPLSALFVVLLFQILLIRGVRTNRAIWLAFLFGFATPIFFRTAHLNHNMFMMMVDFWAFYLLWQPSRENTFPAWKVRFWAGFLAGFGLALDYAGVVPLLALYGYLFFIRFSETSFKQAFFDSLAFVIGAVPPVLFLLFTQWAMYGNPFLPGQYWMPAVHYTDRGWRGFDWPSPDLYWLNMFSLSYGMFTFSPLLLIGFIPVYFIKKRDTLIFPIRERRFSAIFIILFLTFCAANQYSRMQFNTGFRYLLPLVPFVFLAASDHLNRLSNKWLAIISVPTLFHSWVLSMFREPLDVSWRLFFQHGIQLPWLSVLKMVNPPDHPILSNPFLPILFLILCGLVIWGIWKYPFSGESRSSQPILSTPGK